MRNLDWEYDLKLDNGRVSILDNAKKILKLINNGIKK
jgi:hypothetical protein